MLEGGKKEHLGLTRLDTKRTVPTTVIYQVTTGSLSDYTKKCYTRQINDFLIKYNITDVQGIEPLKEYSPKLIRQMVLDYVIFLRDEKRASRATIKIACAAISHFFYMIRDDDARLNWTKVKMEFPPNEQIRARVSVHVYNRYLELAVKEAYLNTRKMLKEVGLKVAPEE